MAKLTKAQSERLSPFGIKAKDEAEAKNIVIAKLAEQDIDDLGDSSLDELLDLLETLGVEEKTEESDEEAEALADEVEEVEEDDDDDQEEEVVVKKTPAPAKKVAPVKAEKVAAAPTKKAKTAPVVEDEEEEEEEEEVAPKKAAKVVAEKPAKVEVAKAAPAKKEKNTSSEKFKFDNPDHAKMLNEFKAVFKANNFDFKHLSEGVAVRHTGIDNTNRCIFTYNHLKVKDGAIVGHVAFNALRLDNGVELLEKHLDEKYTEEGRLKVIMENLPIIDAVKHNEISKVLNKGILGEMEGIMKKYDTKLSKNREKMEEQMKNVKAAPAPVKKKK